MEDVQESVKGGVEEATKEALGDETMYIFLTSVVVLCNHGGPPRLSNVLITGRYGDTFQRL